MPIAEIVARGRQRTNEDYRFLMTDEQGFTTTLLHMQDHSLGDPDYETTPPLKVKNWRYERGKKVRRSRTLRGEELQETMYELNIPDGYIAAPEILAVTRNKCSRQVFFWDHCDDTFVQVQNSIFDALRRRATPIQSANEDGAPLTHYTKFYGHERLYPELGFYVQRAAAGQALYAVDFIYSLCDECDTVENQDGAYTGGGQLVAISDDQFASGSAVSSALPADTIGTDIYADGDTLYVSFAGDADPATATDGGIVKIVNGVSTTVLDLAVGMYAVLFAEKKFWAFGASGNIYTSPDGDNWTQWSNTVMASTHFTRAAFEPKTGNIYLSGHDGTNGKAGKFNGNVLTDISASVGTLTSIKLHTVSVLSEDTDDFAHVAFGGDTGFYSEIPDAENSDTATVVTLPTTTDAVKAILGNSWRTYVGAGSKIHQRSIFTKMSFQTLIASGITGNITDGATGNRDHGVDHVVFVTNSSGTNGSIIMLRPMNSAA